MWKVTIGAYVSGEEPPDADDMMKATDEVTALLGADLCGVFLETVDGLPSEVMGE